jgi:hypothetical protein
MSKITQKNQELLKILRDRQKTHEEAKQEKRKQKKANNKPTPFVATDYK